jgi:DNA polymerase III epsilon subunit-like protein
MMYLGFDLETGGLDKKRHTITEAYFAIWDESWVLIDELHLFLKNDKGEVHGEEEAFKVSGINPQELLANPDTVTYSEGRARLAAMLENHKVPGKRVHYKLLGQNIAMFDIPFMDEQGFFTSAHLKKGGVTHNPIDTTMIVTWLKEIGILPTNIGGLGTLVEYFGLPKATAHRAKNDVHMQKDVYVKLCQLFKNNSLNNVKQDNDDLLKIVEL